MPSFPDYGVSCNPNLAAFVANNLVTQVLHEAQEIVNAANDSGQPWRYILRDKRGNGEFYENAELLGAVDKIKDSNDVKNNDEQQNDKVITSTPQKETDTTKMYNEGSLIGQGDEDFELRNVDLSASTSILINNLFDMSEVEHVATLDVTDDLNNLEPRDSVAKTITSLLESYVDSALNTIFGDDMLTLGVPVSPKSEKYSTSSYSRLDDALGIKISENVTFYIEYESDKSIVSHKTKAVDNANEEEITKKDIDLFEKAFSTLNRDDDKSSEYEESVLQHRKSLTLQDVELKYNSCEIFASQLEPGQISVKETDFVKSSSVTGTRNNSLVKRCRVQGTRLLSRLRSWWWKQRLIGKRKERRVSGLLPGLCPMSPVARSRAASFIDPRKESVSRTEPVLWKFNTVNEALVHSYNRRDVCLN